MPNKSPIGAPFAEQPEKEAFNKSKLTKVLLFLLNFQPIFWYFYAIFDPFWHFLVILGKEEKTKMLSWSPLLKHCAPTRLFPAQQNTEVLSFLILLCNFPCFMLSVLHVLKSSHLYSEAIKSDPTLLCIALKSSLYLVTGHGVDILGNW